jgi:hypothetical protein
MPGPVSEVVLHVELSPAPEDRPFRTPEYQADLRRFEQTVKYPGLRVSPRIELIEAAVGDAPAIYQGVFKIVADTWKTFGQAGVGAALGAWLTARYGRKVRVKIGDIEVEAQSPKQVEELLARAQKFAEKNQAKVIREPRESARRFDRELWHKQPHKIWLIRLCHSRN